MNSRRDAAWWDEYFRETADQGPIRGPGAAHCLTTVENALQLGVEWAWGAIDEGEVCPSCWIECDAVYLDDECNVVWASCGVVMPQVQGGPSPGSGTGDTGGAGNGGSESSPNSKNNANRRQAQDSRDDDDSDDEGVVPSWCVPHSPIPPIDIDIDFEDLHPGVNRNDPWLDFVDSAFPTQDVEGVGQEWTNWHFEPEGCETTGDCTRMYYEEPAPPAPDEPASSPVRLVEVKPTHYPGYDYDLEGPPLPIAWEQREDAQERVARELVEARCAGQLARWDELWGRSLRARQSYRECADDADESCPFPEGACEYWIAGVCSTEQKNRDAASSALEQFEQTMHPDCLGLIHPQ